MTIITSARLPYTFVVGRRMNRKPVAWPKQEYLAIVADPPGEYRGYGPEGISLTRLPVQVVTRAPLKLTSPAEWYHQFAVKV